MKSPRSSTSARWIAIATIIGALVPLAPLVVDEGEVRIEVGAVDAADGPPDTLQAVNKTVNVTTAAPNTTLVYSISYSCPGVVAGGTCATGTITDRIPTYVDIDGNTRQLTFVSAAGNSHFSTGTVSGSSPNQVVTWNATAGLVAGTSGVLSLSVRVPRGLVPATSQVVSNVATATLSGVTDDSPAATTTIAASGTDWSFTKTGPSTSLLNANGTYSLKVCPSPNSAALPPSVSIVDTLPEGATFISASTGGTYTDEVSPTADTVAWTIDAANRPNLDSNGCFTVTAVVRFVPPGSGGDASNQPGVVKTNSAAATVDATTRTSTLNTTLTGPTTRITRSKSVGVGGTYVTDGDRVTWNVSFQNSSDAGADPLTTAVLTDGPLPAPFAIDTITTGTWAWGGTADVAVSADGSSWTDVATGLTGASSTTITSGLAGVAYVRWSWTGSIAQGQSTSGLTISGTVSGAAVPSTTVTNCASATATQGAANFSTSSACASVTLEVPQPHASITKRVNGATTATISPGSAATYTIAIGNNSDATGPLVDPTVTDCVPAGFAVTSTTPGSGWTLDGSYTDSTCSDAGGTPLRFLHSGSIAAGASAATITYAVELNGFDDPDGEIVVPGSYQNTAKVLASDGSPLNHCVQSGCQSTATVTVPVVAQLTSAKEAKGALDADWTTDASTMPGGAVNWRLTLQNTGNVDALDPVFIDIFPHVGDTGVVVWNVARNSDIPTYLVTPIVAPPGWTVWYSTSDDPCRPEVGGPSSSCEAPNWTDTPDTAQMPIYQSVKLEYSGLVARGTSTQFSWQSRVPVLDATYDTPDSTESPYDAIIACAGDPSTCPAAVNSFAYGTHVDPADLNGMSDPGLLSSEPPVVSVSVTQPPRPNAVGDMVFSDVDHDGIQDPGEPGIPNVRIELDVYDTGSSSWGLNYPYGYTYTDSTGRYLFPDLVDGLYRMRFYLPDTDAYVTLQDVTGVAGDAAAPALNSGDDSDVPTSPSGSDAYGNYYQTPDFELGGIVVDEIDEAWDAGLWIPEPSIAIVKRTNGVDTTDAPGIELFPGDPVTWTYTITNDGNTYLTDVALVDVVTDSGEDDPAPVCAWAGSTDAATPAGTLSRGESVTCTAVGTVIEGTYANEATVTATGTLDPTDPADTGTYGVLDRVAGGASVSASDTGHYTGASYALGDLVFVDVDGDGRYNPPVDVPIRNSTVVQLFDDADQLVASTTTTAGRYLFSGLRPGSYYVEVPAAEFADGGALAELGPAPSPVLDPNGGADETTDHHAVLAPDLGVRTSGLVVLSSHASGAAHVGDAPTGEDGAGIAAGLDDARTDQTIDIGLAGPHPLIIQTDAACVAGYPQLSYRLDYRYFTPTTVGTVQLYPYLAGPDGDWGTDDDVPSGTPVQTIANVPLGEWTDQLWPGTSTSPRDWPGWVLTDGVWQIEHDGLTPKLLVRATVDATNTAVAVYPLTVPACEPPVASIGDRVWWDQDGDGVQQIGEPGIANASVTVRWAGLDDVLGNGDDVVHPAITTDATGAWTLTSLPSGVYDASVVLPDADELVASHDLDGLGTAGATFTLADAQDRTDVDFGYVARLSVGDLVFNDVDGDGLYDAAIDTGVDGVTVQLLDVDGDVIATTTTDADGRYAFSGLLPGEYAVAIPASEFATGERLDGWRIGLLPVADPDTDADEDVDHHAVASGGGAVTGLVTLSATLAGDGQLTGDEPGGMVNATVDLALRAPSSISLVKTVDDGSGWADAGHVGFLGGVDWRVVVTNDGGQLLHSIVVTDPAVGGCAAAAAPDDGVLDPGESMILDCSSVNLVHGFTNTAAVTGLDPADEEVSDTDAAIVTVDPPVPGIVLVKYVTPDLADSLHGDLRDANDLPGFVAAEGTEITWVYSLANTGNTPLDLSTFVDSNTSALPDDDFPVLGSMYVEGDTDGDGLLDVDEQWWFVTPTATSIPAGPTETDAQVLAYPTDASGAHLDGVDPVTDTDPATVFGTTAVLTIEKTTNALPAETAPGSFVRVGDQVVWQYVVRNGSNTALADLAVVDDPAADIDCPSGNPIPFLAVGDSETCTATVDESAVLGQFRNDVTVTGTPVDDLGDPLVGPGIVPQVATDTSHYFGWDAAVEIVKAIDAVDPVAPTADEDAQTAPGPIHPAGASVVWTFRVTNTGVVPLTDVDVTDSSGLAVECPADVIGDDASVIRLLVPGATVVCTATATVETGGRLTTASASGAPSYPTGSDFSGDAIDAISWPTDPDVYATIEDASGPVDDVSDTDDAHQFGWQASISVVKRVNGSIEPEAPGLFLPAGSPVTWTYTVSNDGFVPLTDVTVVDDVEGTPDCGPADGDDDGDIDLLLPGDAFAVECALAGTAIDPASDPHYVNEVRVSGQPSYPALDPAFDPEPDAGAPSWPTDVAAYVAVPEVGDDFGTSAVAPVTDTDVAHYTVASPAVTIVKTVNGHDANEAPGVHVLAGAPLVWRYSVTNTGNTSLADVTVLDDRVAAAEIDCGDGTNVVALLEAGGTTTCRADGTAVVGRYTNIGTVTAMPVDGAGMRYLDPATGDQVAALTASDPASIFGARPAIEIDKTVCADPASSCDTEGAGSWVEDAYIPAGADAVWRIDVTNTGNVTLVDVVVDDPLADACSADVGSLVPGGTVSWTCTSTSLTGPIDNVATVVATAVDPQGELVRDPDGRSVTVSDDDGAAVSPPTDLQLGKSVATGPVRGSAPIEWVLSVGNVGPGWSPDTVVTDVLPQGMALVETPDGTTYDASTRTLRWPVGMLAPGASASLRYSTRVVSGGGGNYTNVASVESHAVLLPESLADDAAQATARVVGGSGGVLARAGGSFGAIVSVASGALLAGLLLLLAGRRRDLRP